jgi:hypothetical protein
MTNDAHPFENWYIQYAQAANAAQWPQQAMNIAWQQGNRWILNVEGTWSPLPEPIDPDLLMDEGL